MEKIDKMREIAGTILQKSLKHRLKLDALGQYPFSQNFPDKDLLCSLFIHAKYYDE